MTKESKVAKLLVESGKHTPEEAKKLAAQIIDLHRRHPEVFT